MPTAKNITSVVFDISRYGRHTQTLLFKEPVNQQDAITRAEKFLSQDLTDAYYNQVKDDLVDEPMSWNEAKVHYHNAGACLGDCRFLEIAEFNNGTLTLGCDS